jgi:hypothetical protein
MPNEKLETAFRKLGTWRPPHNHLTSSGGKSAKSSASFSKTISNSVTKYRPTQAIVSFGNQPSQEVKSALPLNQYDPADTVLRQTSMVPEQIHTVTTVTADQTVEVPTPAQTVPLEDPSRSRKFDNGLAIW